MCICIRIEMQRTYPVSSIWIKGCYSAYWKSWRQIILDTPKNTDRAHLFYEKAGFKKIEKEELPIEYDYPYDDSDFFCLTLNGYQ